MRVTPVVIALSVALFGATSATWGQGVGGNSPTETTHMIERVYSVPENPTDWWGSVGSAENPLGVELDPAGPVWRKEFNIDLSQPVLPHEILPNEIVLITEHLSIQNTRPWTGWQMEILDDNFHWSTGWPSRAFDIRVNGVRVPGLSVELLGSVARGSFDPLPTGTLVEIQARIAYEGTVSSAAPIHIQQFPIPEPATLLGFLVLAFLIQRR